MAACMTLMVLVNGIRQSIVVVVVVSIADAFVSGVAAWIQDKVERLSRVLQLRVYRETERRSLNIINYHERRTWMNNIAEYIVCWCWCFAIIHSCSGEGRLRAVCDQDARRTYANQANASTHENKLKRKIRAATTEAKTITDGRRCEMKKKKNQWKRGRCERSYHCEHGLCVQNVNTFACFR